MTLTAPCDSWTSQESFPFLTPPQPIESGTAPRRAPVARIPVQDEGGAACELLAPLRKARPVASTAHVWAVKRDTMWGRARQVHHSLPESGPNNYLFTTFFLGELPVVWQLPQMDEAQAILDRALERYRRPNGYEGDLVDTAGQLMEHGTAAWPCLRALAKQRVPECEFFVHAIVAARGVPPREKTAALLDLAANRSLNTRSRLLEYIDDLPTAMLNVVLRQLCDAGQPDDDATDRARELAARRQ